MHSVSTVQCELVCFPGGHFADHVIITIKRMAPYGGANWMAWTACTEISVNILLSVK